jgi:hypothetical protein
MLAYPSENLAPYVTDSTRVGSIESSSQRRGDGFTHCGEAYRITYTLNPWSIRTLIAIAFGSLT